MLHLLLFVLPLGLDTLGVSINLGIKSHLSEASLDRKSKIPSWLASALLFSAAETLMPLLGLALGYAVSLLISAIMHFVGPLLLIAVGLWELQEEIRERTRKRKKLQEHFPSMPATESQVRSRITCPPKAMLIRGTLIGSVGAGSYCSPLASAWMNWLLAFR